MKFKLGKTEFEVSFLFAALLCLMVLFDKTGFIKYFFLAAAIHEAIHLLVMWLIKSPPSKIKLAPGGIFIIDKSVNSMFEDVLILVSGPLVNLICFLVFSGDFSFISLILFVYNSLPVKGLDGGSIVWLTVNHIFSKKAAEIVLNIISFLVALLFLGAFIVLMINGIPNYSLLVFSLYMISCIFLKKGVERNV